MSTNKHTPGPWSTTGDPELKGWINGPNGQFVCTYYGCGSHEAEWRSLADYQLAVAAPELLGALKDLVNTFDPSKQSIYTFAQPQIDAARAAIARAEGEK